MLVPLAALRSIPDGGDPHGASTVCAYRKRKPDRVVSLCRRSRSAASVRRQWGDDRACGLPPTTRFPGSSSLEWQALRLKTERPSWTLVGAGSLGSKVALHLARAGSGPSVVLDRSGMAPHNAARHALVPATGEMQIFWADAKARMLSQAMQGLNQTAIPIAADATFAC